MPGLTIASVFDGGGVEVVEGGPLPVGYRGTQRARRRADLDFASFEREGDDAFDAVDGLLAGVLAVGDGKVGFTLSGI